MRLIPQFIRTIQANNRNRRAQADAHAAHAKDVFILGVPMMDPRRMSEKRMWELRDEVAALRVWLFMCRSRYLRSLYPMGSLEHLIYWGECKRNTEAQEKMEAEVEDLFRRVTIWCTCREFFDKPVVAFLVDGIEMQLYPTKEHGDLMQLIAILADNYKKGLKEDGNVRCPQGK